MERDQVINFLLNACDSKNRVIEQLQRQAAEFQKKIQELEAAKTKLTTEG